MYVLILYILTNKLLYIEVALSIHISVQDSIGSYLRYLMISPICQKELNVSMGSRSERRQKIEPDDGKLSEK